MLATPLETWRPHLGQNPGSATEYQMKSSNDLKCNQIMTMPIFILLLITTYELYMIVIVEINSYLLVIYIDCS